MRFPLWILAVLITVSLVFAGFTAYNLFKAEVLSPSSAQEAISQAAEIALPERQQNVPAGNPNLPAQSEGTSETKQGVSEKTRPAARYEKKINDVETTVVVSQPKERSLQKIGSVGVNAGEITQVALTR